jgi:hypothetical protein
MPVNRHAVELGVLVGLVNTVIFLHFMPPVSDIKTVPQNNPDIESSERTALMVTTAFTLLVAGFARSWDTFLVGGAVIVGTDFAFKHANAVNPTTGKMTTQPENAGLDNVHPLPDYASPDTGTSTG